MRPSSSRAGGSSQRPARARSSPSPISPRSRPRRRLDHDLQDRPLDRARGIGTPRPVLGVEPSPFRQSVHATACHGVSEQPVDRVPEGGRLLSGLEYDQLQAVATDLLEMGGSRVRVTGLG